MVTVPHHPPKVGARRLSDRDGSVTVFRNFWASLLTRDFTTLQWLPSIVWLRIQLMMLSTRYMMAGTLIRRCYTNFWGTTAYYITKITRDRFKKYTTTNQQSSKWRARTVYSKLYPTSRRTKYLCKNLNDPSSSKLPPSTVSFWPNQCPSPSQQKLDPAISRTQSTIS